MKNFILLLTLVIGSSVTGQVNLKKLSSPCDCVDQAAKYSKNVLKEANKEEDPIIQQNILDHYNVDKDLIVDYCDDKYNMRESIKDCERFESFVDLLKEIDEVKMSVSKKLKGTIYDKTDESAEVVEDTETAEVPVDNGFNPFEAADDFCACADLEEEDQKKCHQEWVDKYKAPMTDGTATIEQGRALGRRMGECDPDNAMNVLKML